MDSKLLSSPSKICNNKKRKTKKRLNKAMLKMLKSPTS
jgi:hypothetical protein